MPCLYVLLSLKDNRKYYCRSINAYSRLKEHNDGKVISTKNRRPLKLIYIEEVSSLEAAIKKEKYFKTGFGRKYIINKLKHKGPIV
ncbi:hypothetical protein A2963_00295 [Candidatus Roizmanbacteria bacterium RIFCSPLOWO2_01_FULL_40_13]|nr:MAG: hypothetical protein A2963_00295 [Candidatus Roizmanbacteria bacterium RIFCSPLOWO2_01_FULL_40_13]